VETVEFANESATKTLSETFARAAVANAEEEEKTARDPLYLASGSRDKKICIWDAWGGTTLLKISGHDNWVRGLQFHPNGAFLYSCSDDKSIRVWELATGR
jgi:platelet-activating factor acetylhydrolase IB subunit alpha